jgi:hypothetical protein
MAIQGIVGDQLSYNFRIVKKDGTAQLTRIVAWAIDDGTVTPVTFPSPAKGEKLEYETPNGWKEV